MVIAISPGPCPHLPGPVALGKDQSTLTEHWHILPSPDWSSKTRGPICFCVTAAFTLELFPGLLFTLDLTWLKCPGHPWPTDHNFMRIGLEGHGICLKPDRFCLVSVISERWKSFSRILLSPEVKAVSDSPETIFLQSLIWSLISQEISRPKLRPPLCWVSWEALSAVPC